MVQKVRGIVLHHLNYGDTSIIVHFYTDIYGRISVMIKGARGQKKNRKISLYHPLAILELDLIFKENRDLQQIREARPLVPLHGIIADPIKSSVSLFLAEVFFRSIREKESNKNLFEYLFNSIQLFDLLEEGTNLFHLHVIIHLSKYLGFRPEAPEVEGAYWFELETGLFSKIKPILEYHLDPRLTAHLITLLRITGHELGQLRIPRKDRNELLEKIILYYRLQMDGMGEIKSLAILKTVFE
jgi:DNA repair protein RecO (recombination protein O)